jgi:hypothetical protein
MDKISAKEGLVVIKQKEKSVWAAPKIRKLDIKRTLLNTGSVTDGADATHFLG